MSLTIYHNPRCSKSRQTLLKDEADAELLKKAMVENPKLIERPIVTNDNRAILGRPPEAVVLG